MRPTVGGRYLHWDALRRREPPTGLTRAEWWTGVKLSRVGLSRLLPLRDVRGRPFSFARSEQVLHVPPPAATLPARMDAMVRFAEEGLGDGSFLHPVVQAIVLHFWLAYDHPFEDGNGRTARALFYWSMLRRGYWVHQIDVILRALDALDEYVRTKTEQVQQVERMLRRSSNLNHRQLALLAHALRHPGAEYTTRSHRTSHAVAYATARADLFRLAELEWLERRRVGRRDNVFRAPPDLAGRIRRR